MDTPISITTAAKRLGLSDRRVRTICNEHGIGFTIDGVVGRLLSQSDIALIEAYRGKRGNPNLGKAVGNNGGGKKPAKSKRKTAVSKKSRK